MTRHLAALILIAMTLLLAVHGQPIDPLVREAEHVGSYTWQIGLGYTPVGSQGTGVDPFGFPYSYVRLAHGVELSLTGTLNIRRGFKVGAQIADTTWHVIEQQTSLQETVDERTIDREFAYIGFGETRLAPDTTLDPRVTLSLGNPQHHTLGVSVNILRDPMVLSGEVSFGRHASAPHERLSMSLAAGFVANAWITLQAHAGWSIPLREAALPVATLGIAVGYDLDLLGDLTVNVRCTLHLTGSTTLLSLKLEVAGRSR